MYGRKCYRTIKGLTFCSLQISPIFSSLQVGEPITISVYFRDDTHKYDAVVKECWASDIEDYEIAKHKLKITK